MDQPSLSRRACGLALLTLSAALPLAAQTTRDYAIDLAAVVTSAVPRITLSWTQRRQSEITAQTIYRRLKGAASWTQLATLATTQTGYIDSNALAGVEYEYRMQRVYTSQPMVGMGYLSAGLEVPFVESRGKLLLVVDDTMTNALVPEITQLRADLAGDGWTVQMLTALRSATAATVKAQIKAAYNADPANVKMVFLLGHVPVPYSGNINPDGHTDHKGAWPADGYYGEMNGSWTDLSINNTTASDARNDNIPGDGKFDQSTLPSDIELMVGRVDLHSMTEAPSSAVTETALLRRYLRKAHDYRHKQGAYADIGRRTLLRDGWGWYNGGVFSIVAWAQGFTSVSVPPAAPVFDEAPSGQWFAPAYAGGKSYLVGFGGGGGSWEYANTLGTSADFGRRPSGVVFNSQFGSYFGDWDRANALMRSVLAGTATGDSLGLSCFWNGRPHWFMHHTGMGETLGYSARLSMNALVSAGYEPAGNFQRYVHTGLLGDPALRLHVVAPPRRLAAASANSQVTLLWAAPEESNLLGYHVYRAATPEGPFTRLTPALQTATNYSDGGVSAGQSYSYLVRSLKLERTPGGSYSNLSVGASVTLTAQAAALAAPRNPTALTVTMTAATNAILAWSDNADDEGGFRIERRLNAGGAYAAVGTAAANAAAFADAGPFTQGNVYVYRVVATNAAGDSPFSPEVSVDAVAGYFDFSDTKTKVNKNAGSAVIAVNRFGGAVGAVSVNYASSNWTATNGTHYTAASGTLTWSDGETNAKSITVPLINTASAQQPREFRLTLSSPTGGGALAVATRLAVLIEDPTATLDAPWAQVQLGTITDGSPAVSAEGGLGSAVMGGSGVTDGATSEAGRFIYQSRSGDSVLTAYFPNGVPSNDGTLRCAVMARASTANNAIMAASVGSVSSSFGHKLVTRSAVGGGATVQPSTNNIYRLPRWLRLIRVGNVFTAESSADGAIWERLGSATLSSMPNTAQWGLFHYSANWAYSTTYLGDYYTALAQQVTLTEWPPPAPAAPPAPLDFAGAAVFGDGALLQWSDTADETGYQIERRVADGTFAPLAALSANTISYADGSALPSFSYVYRLRATNLVGVSEWVSITLARREHALPYREPFESFEPDFALPGFEGWIAEDPAAARVATNGARLAGLLAYAQPIGLPLRAEAHDQVAVFESTITNRLAAPSNSVVWSDMMVELTRHGAGLPSLVDGAQCAWCVDADGRLNIWHHDLLSGTSRWSAVAWQTEQTSHWVRATLHQDFATPDTLHHLRYFQLFIDGVAQSNTLAWSSNDGSGVPGGSWFAMATGAPTKLSALLFEGGGAIDDLVVDTARPLIGLGPHGTPEWWLADHDLTNGNSLAANELEDADNDRFPNWKEREAFTDPNDPESLLRVTALAEPLANGRLPLTLQTVPGQRYTLQGSTNLVANLWEEVPFSLTPEDAPVIQTVAAEETTLLLYVAPDALLRFYRVTLVP